MKKTSIPQGTAVKGIFTIDSIPGKKFKGYTFGEDWNGWATPYFEIPETHEISRILRGKKVYDKVPYFIFPEEGNLTPSISELTDGPYKQEKIQTVDGEKIVYPIGAYAWIWENELMADGGGISNAHAAELAKIYSTGTAKQLWEAWTKPNRVHFLLDHATESFELMGDDFNKSSKDFSAQSYDSLPEPIRRSIVIHHAQGMYADGGGLSGQEATVLVISSKNPLYTQLTKLGSPDAETLETNPSFNVLKGNDGKIFVAFPLTYIAQVDKHVIDDDLSYIQKKYKVSGFNWTRKPVFADGGSMANGGSIDKVWNFTEWGTKSYRQLIDEGKFSGKYKSIENAVQFDRIKYNRMNGSEQSEYTKKLNRKVTKYNFRAAGSDDSSYTVSKEIYDYANVPELPEKDYYQHHEEPKGYIWADGGGVDSSFEYQMLGRLQADNEYYLGYGNRSEKQLWAGNVDEQITEMKRLWNKVPVKPEWLSMDDILDYEKKMKEQSPATMSDGGGVNLFEDYENIPQKVQRILDKYPKVFADGDSDYRILKKALNDLEKIGYTFEYGLDGSPYDLRKIGEKGKSEDSLMKDGGQVRMYNFMKEDLQKLEKAISEGDKEEVERFFSYWGQHLNSLKTKTNDRMYNFLKDDIEKLEKAVNENDKEEIERFFSYWDSHLKSLKMADGGAIEAYIDYLNKKKGFKQDRKTFTGKNAMKDAEEWGRKNLENYHPDMVHIKFLADGGGIESPLQKLIGQLDDLRIDLEDEDEETLANVTGELEEAKTDEEAKKILSDKQAYLNNISDKNVLSQIKDSISQFNSIKIKSGGRGFFGLEKGEKIKSEDEISKGDILLEHSDQFNADNTVKVTEIRKYGTNVHVSGIYWDPIKNQRIGNEEFAIDPRIGMRNYYRVKSNSKLSPAKKKILDRITTLKATKANAGAAAQKAIQKKIDVLQRQFDYNPSAKEKAQDNKGRFAMDVPAKYSKAIYKKLWAMNVLPRIHTLKGTSSIVVSSKLNLDKAYTVYSDLLKQDKEKAPSLASISRKV